MFGTRLQGKVKMYPDDCLQSIVSSDDWWVENKENKLSRGSLVFAFAPHVDQVPYTFEPVARAQAEEHSSATIRVAPLKVDQPLKRTDLPVAAMPLHGNEIWAAYRAKKRPCIVLGSECPVVDSSLIRGKPKNSTAPTILMAPYYGADQNGKRAGYSEEFVERVRHCEYPQFVWDKLPVSGAKESILRLDHLQPLGTHNNSFKLTTFKLSEEALSLIDELLKWMVWGGVEKDSLLLLYRELIEESFPLKN